MTAQTSVSTAAGTTIGIVLGAPATFDATGYAALTFVPIGEITDVPDFGREFELITHKPLGSRGTVKKKGGFNEGSIDLKLGLNTDDAGTVLLKAAALSDADYSFKIAHPTGDVYYFRALALSFKVGTGNSGSIISATCKLELQTSSAGVGIVEVLAA
ncbi:MAG: hypothetical protein A3I66_00635 [Burkholderiales bacterium RIFCSPLOWO2_02_FULL_57_36]|nr:MAG: hypothetical protein A3I66_00635 [Burkholderiales bacterium RIFCSPLOWO2_02_FULL_57_36]